MSDDGDKRKAMKTVAGLPGIDSISIDMKERKLTIIGTVDPTKVVSRLRKHWTTELLIVGPAKEPEKEEPKKDGAKKEEAASDKKPADNNEPKKEGGGEEKKKPEEPGKGDEKKEGGEAAKANAAAVSGGGEGGGKKEEEKKVDPVLEMVNAYRAYNPQMTKYYYVHSMEENPNACVIC